eukprot:366383-Chlamydomonas_euryale.AAC.9
MCTHVTGAYLRRWDVHRTRATVEVGIGKVALRHGSQPSARRDHSHGAARQCLPPGSGWCGGAGTTTQQIKRRTLGASIVTVLLVGGRVSTASPPFSARALFIARKGRAAAGPTPHRPPARDARIRATEPGRLVRRAGEGRREAGELQASRHVSNACNTKNVRLMSPPCRTPVPPALFSAPRRPSRRTDEAALGANRSRTRAGVDTPRAGQQLLLAALDAKVLVAHTVAVGHVWPHMVQDSDFRSCAAAL